MMQTPPPVKPMSTTSVTLTVKVWWVLFVATVVAVLITAEWRIAVAGVAALIAAPALTAPLRRRGGA